MRLLQLTLLAVSPAFVASHCSCYLLSCAKRTDELQSIKSPFLFSPQKMASKRSPGGMSDAQTIQIGTIMRSTGPFDPVNMRCFNGESNSTSETLSIYAGSWLAMGTGRGSFSRAFGLAHDGVDLKDWDGAGKVWFRIHEVTAYPVRTNPHSETYTLNFPAHHSTRRAEKYLVRMEVIALHNAIKNTPHLSSIPPLAEGYISCGQLNVTNPKEGGTPGPLVEFPGFYTGNVDGLNFQRSYTLLMDSVRNRESESISTTKLPRLTSIPDLVIQGQLFSQ
ncbi:hypothetical protein FA15DRAFT_657381 [Coprinopsis marcescibilis]|uniref:lytic cellulose monooxygenase (C4-dehydrogenating) n=1 Tax=Coprinopsis marcescibilis TaxID=230819 RepID=A0A5C3KQW0_COPMA|nr:hypothetical protein FA15DRAFT_657381 [Coprinopsis marcescibilis]